MRFCSFPQCKFYDFKHNPHGHLRTERRVLNIGELPDDHHYVRLNEIGNVQRHYETKLTPNVEWRSGAGRTFYLCKPCSDALMLTKKFEDGISKKQSNIFQERVKVLTRPSLLFNKQHIHIDDVEYSDFLDGMDFVLRHDMIVFLDDDGKIKLLKNRHGDHHESNYGRQGRFDNLHNDPRRW